MQDEALFSLLRERGQKLEDAGNRETYAYNGQVYDIVFNRRDVLSHVRQSNDPKWQKMARDLKRYQ